MESLGVTATIAIILALLYAAFDSFSQIRAREMRKTFIEYCNKDMLKSDTACADLDLKIFDREAWVRQQALKQGLYE